MKKLRPLVLIVSVILLNCYFSMKYVFRKERRSINRRCIKGNVTDSIQREATDFHGNINRGLSHEIIQQNTVTFSLRQWKLNMYLQGQEVAKDLLPVKHVSLPVKNVSLPEEFRPAINSSQYFLMLEVWDQFTKTCVENDITYILYGGTLLGSYRHHGIIPWDDDLDVLAKQTDLEKLQKVLSKVEGYGIHLTSHCLKFFKLPATMPKKLADFYWPFVDIFYYKENSTHICDAGWVGWCWERAKYFPVKLRPFEDGFHPVPADVVYALSIEGKRRPYYCKSNFWNHQREMLRKLYGDIHCDKLFPFYPFVNRTYEERTLKEILAVNGTVLNEFTFKQELCTN